MAIDLKDVAFARSPLFAILASVYVVVPADCETPSLTTDALPASRMSSRVTLFVIRAAPMRGVTTNRTFPPSNFLSNFIALKIFLRGNFDGNRVGNPNPQEDQQLRHADPPPAQPFSSKSRKRRRFQGSLLLHVKISGNFRHVRSRDQLLAEIQKCTLCQSCHVRLSRQFSI